MLIMVQNNLDILYLGVPIVGKMVGNVEHHP